MKTISLEQAGALVAQGGSKSGEERAADVRERLYELVMYAKEHSPYFKRAYSDIGESFELSELPVTTKAGLMECYEDWVTDRDITLDGVMEYLSDIKNVNTAFLGRYSAITTSGTTGAPMPMVRDGHRNMIHGCLIAQRLLKGIDPDIMNPAHTRIASVIVTDFFSSSYASAMRAKHRAGEFSENFNIFSVLTPMSELVARLNAAQPEFLTGYASALALLAKERVSGALTIKPKALASSAEMLSGEVYAALKEAFNCPVLNNYCSTEGGEIAMSCSEGRLHLNEDWIIVEPVDGLLKPAKKDDWSDGVLITDLSNYVQPIIRYHVNDRVKISPSDCKCGSNLPVLEILGRESDKLCFNGVTIPPFVFQLCSKKTMGLFKSQFVQTGENSLEIRFLTAESYDWEEIGNEIMESLKQIFANYNCGDVSMTLSKQDFLRNERGGKVPDTVRL